MKMKQRHLYFSRQINKMRLNPFIHNFIYYY